MFIQFIRNIKSPLWPSV